MNNRNYLISIIGFFRLYSVEGICNKNCIEQECSIFDINETGACLCAYPNSDGSYSHECEHYLVTKHINIGYFLI